MTRGRLRHDDFTRLPLLRGRNTVAVVRFLTAILITVLLLFSTVTPSATACATTACCGATCARSAPVNQVSCCQAPAASDTATNQARNAQHLDSFARLPVVTNITAISALRDSAIIHRFVPPDRLVSLALLCSRQL